MSAMAGYANDLASVDWSDGSRRRPIDARRAAPHSVCYASMPATAKLLNERVALLSDGQRDCLRMVYAHMTSKDIARALGVSPHTVDMRLRTAMKTLGVASRIDAARALIDTEGDADAYQPLIYQASDVAGGANVGRLGVPASSASYEYATQHSDPRLSPDFDPSAGGPPRQAGASLPFRDDILIATGRQGERSSPAPLAPPVPWGSRNTLSPGARLAWIAAIAIGSALGFGAVLGALAALTKLL